MVVATMLSAKMNDWICRVRGLLTRIVLIAGLLAVFLYLAPFVPRDTRIMLDLGEQHANVVQLDLTYRLGQDELRTTTLRYPAGAPRRVQQDVRLPGGDIALASRQTLRDGRTLEELRRFTIPAEAEVRIALNKE
jgi:hypothetical protein